MLFEASDDDLMRSVQRGDSAAFGRLLERHTRCVFGTSMRYLGGNRARAEDITQEVWMTVLAKCEFYKPEGKFRAWLLTVTRNAALMEIRRSSRFSELDEEKQIPDSEPAADSLFSAAEDRGRIQKEIDALDTGERTALLLWLGGDLSYEEIAAEMTVSLATARSLIFRAKQRIKRNLGGGTP
jgi:RNA polymerase sigma factor (sigma-70 family)